MAPIINRGPPRILRSGSCNEGWAGTEQNKVLGCQGAKVPKCQSAKVPKCQSARVLGCCGNFATLGVPRHFGT